MYGYRIGPIFKRDKIVKLGTVSHHETGTTKSLFDRVSDELAEKWLAEVEPTIAMKVDELYSIIETFTSEIDNLKGQVEQLRIERGLSNGYITQKVVVPDYPDEDVEYHKKNILNRMMEERTLDPWDYASEVDIDIGLALLCFDELIDEGKLERANDEGT